MLRRVGTFDSLAAHFLHAVLDPAHSGEHPSTLERLAITARDEPGDYAV